MKSQVKKTNTNLTDAQIWFVRTVFLFLLGFKVPAVGADESDPRFHYSGNDLYVICDGDAANTFQLGVCFGSLWTVWRFLEENKKVCMPPTLSISQMTDVMYKFLKENPVERGISSTLHLQSALLQAWSCNAAVK